MVGAPPLYDAVGGMPFFTELVAEFYRRVAADPVLRPLYPEDLTEPEARMAGFLVQYWGGPTTYSEQRGHPRLRMRHMPFRIGPAERDAWLAAMEGAIEASPAAEPWRSELLAYVRMAAAHMVNAP